MDGFKMSGRRSLFVEITFSNGVLRASLAGPRIGDREATMIANAINLKLKGYRRKVKSLVLDFREVHFISSLGLGMCIDVRNKASDVSADTRIVGLTNNLLELFQMMKLHKLFHLDTEQCMNKKTA